MADNNQNQKSFRRNQNAEKLIESQKADRDALKASQNQTEAIKNLSTPDTVDQKDYSPELQEINTAVQTSAAASELELDISQELLELQRASSTQQMRDNQSLMEKVDSASLEIQEWLNEILDKEPPPVLIPEPLPPEVPKAREPDLKETIPQNEEKKERKENNSAVLAQLASMNKNIQGMAGNLTQMLLQTSLQAIKMTAIAAAGILALDIVVGIAKTLYEKYSVEIQELWKDTKDFLTKTWEVITGLGTTVGEGLQKYFKDHHVFDGLIALTNLVKDISGGDFLSGFTNFMDFALNSFHDGITTLFEGLIRKIPGMTKIADNIGAARAQRQIDRGVMPNADDLATYKKAGQLGTESLGRQIKRHADRGAEIAKLAKERGIKLEEGFSDAWTDSNEGKSKEYIALREEVEKYRPDLRAPSVQADIEIKQAQLTNKAEKAVRDISSTPTVSELETLEKIILELDSNSMDTSRYEQILSEAQDKRNNIKQEESNKRFENEEAHNKTENSLKPTPQVIPAPQPVPVQQPIKQDSTVNNNTIIQQSSVTQNSFIAPGKQSLQSFTAY